MHPYVRCWHRYGRLRYLCLQLLFLSLDFFRSLGCLYRDHGLFFSFPLDPIFQVIEIANCCLMRDAMSNPCPLVTTCYRKGKAFRRAVYVFLVQLVAAYTSFHLARFFWGFEIHPKHTESLEDDGPCSSDLTVGRFYSHSVNISQVALSIGCLVEGAATFVGKWFEKWSGERFGETWTGSIASSIFSGFICALGRLCTVLVST